MNQPNFYYILGALSLLGNSLGFAQTASPTPNATPASFVDIHPYQSQTFFRLNEAGFNNGLIEVIPAVTVKDYFYFTPGIKTAQHALDAALFYDKRNPLPASLVFGNNYSFYQGGYMATITADGFFQYKGKSFFTPDRKGGVYFTEQGTQNLVVVDSYGYFYNTFNPTPNILLAGGNFFIDKDGALTTIKSVGVGPGNAVGMVNRYDPTVEGFNFSDAWLVGGNYFVKSDGSIVTVASTTGYFSAPYVDARPKFMGGNYFIGLDDFLYTISADGTLNKNTDFNVKGATPITMGYSFMRFADNKFWMVDGDGFPHTNMVHVSTTGIKTDLMGALSQSIDLNTIFLPARR